MAHFAYLSSTRSWRETHHPEIPTQPRGRVFAPVCLDELALALAPRPGIGMSLEVLSWSSEELDDALAMESNCHVYAYLLDKGEHSTVEDYDLVGERARALFRVILPSSLGCRVPPEGRFIYGAVGDRFAPGGAYEMWKLWGRPSVHWHAGGHLTATMAPAVWRYIFDALGN